MSPSLPTYGEDSQTSKPYATRKLRLWENLEQEAKDIPEIPSKAHATPPKVPLLRCPIHSPAVLLSTLGCCNTWLLLCAFP